MYFEVEVPHYMHHHFVREIFWAVSQVKGTQCFVFADIMLYIEGIVHIS